MLAPSTLNMLPKLLDAPMRTYLVMFANTLRPSSTPSSTTTSDFSSRIMSADALAMSAAVLTLIPTSAACSAGASVMPSPMKPTAGSRRPEGLDDALLVGRGYSREQRGGRGGVDQRSLGHLLDVGAEHDRADREPDLLAHLARDELVVAGD